MDRNTEIQNYLLTIRKQWEIEKILRNWLILCREFVEKNGGKIWAESKEGEGAAFFFTIPVKEM